MNLQDLREALEGLSFTIKEQHGQKAHIYRGDEQVGCIEQLGNQVDIHLRMEGSFDQLMRLRVSHGPTA